MDYFCRDACDCGPAHCCKENRCIKDLDDPWLTKMNGEWTGPPACEVGVDATYCCSEPYCVAGRSAYGAAGYEHLFVCQDQESGTSSNFCSGEVCYGNTCNCGPGESCVDMLTSAPPGATCFLFHSGGCVSNALAEAVYDWGSGDLIPCGSPGCPVGTKMIIGWQSGGAFAYQRVIGRCGFCGDDVCDVGEFPGTCPQDCNCGDGACAPSEVGSCSADCGTCGDGDCAAWESPYTCALDCQPGRDDGWCQLDEFWSAPEDCGCPDALYYPGIYAVCGDEYYAGASTYNPETDLNCPGECSTVSIPFSGPASPEDGQIVWSQRLGGVTGGILAYFAPDNGRDIHVNAGFVYLTGATYSRDFPVTYTLPVTFTSSYNYDWDAFAAKLDTEGEMIFARYLGIDSGFGHERDVGRAVAADDEGNLYITGSMELVFLTPDGGEIYTNTTGVYDLEGGYAIALDPDEHIYLAGSQAVGALRLLPDGTPDYHTPDLGGTAYDMAIDSFGNAYIAGSMGITRLDPSGTQVYTVTLQGTGYGIALHEDKVYVVGHTASEWFSTTGGAFDSGEDPQGDAFLAVMDASSGDLLYATYLGEDGYDIAWDVAVDAHGYAYIVGETYSASFPTSSKALDDTLNGFGDIFVAVLNPVGGGVDDLLYGSYIGGNDPMEPPYNTPDRGYGIALDEAGYVYITGETGSADFPTTDADPPLGFTDVFVMKLDLWDFFDRQQIFLPLVISP